MPVTEVNVLNIVAGVLAATAPGVCWWVMKKMSANFVCQMEKRCETCKGEIDDRIETLESSEQTMNERQVTLRETIIPGIRETYAKQSDVTQGTAEIKEMIRGFANAADAGRKELSDRLSAGIKRVHERIDNFHERLNINGGRP